MVLHDIRANGYWHVRDFCLAILLHPIRRELPQDKDKDDLDRININ